MAHGAGYFAPAAATCVMGVQAIVFARQWNLALACWVAGALYYLTAGALVADRLLRQRDRSAVEPPIWVAMGGAAISALAGSLLGAWPAA